MTHDLIRAMVAAQGDPDIFRRAVSDAIFARAQGFAVDAADAAIVLATLAKAAALGNEIPIMRRIVSRIIITHPVSAQAAPGETGGLVRAETAQVGEKPRGEAPAQRGEVSQLTADPRTAGWTWSNPEPAQDVRVGLCGCGGFPGDPRPGYVCPEHERK